MEFPKHPTKSQLERSQAISSVIKGLVDTQTAHEGMMMGFTPEGEFDIKPIEPVIPSLPGVEWEDYLNQVNW